MTAEVAGGRGGGVTLLMASALLLFPFTSFHVGVRKSGAVPRRAAVPLCGTCRVCKNSYDPADNGPRACQHHPGTIRGESARKGNWEGARGTDEGQSGDLVYSWTCCGQPGWHLLNILYF